MGKRAILPENRLVFIERRSWGTEEQPDVDRLVPQHGFLTGSLPVTGVVSLVFKFGHPRPEKRIVVVMIECHTRTKDVDKREAAVLPGV